MHWIILNGNRCKHRDHPMVQYKIMPKLSLVFSFFWFWLEKLIYFQFFPFLVVCLFYKWRQYFVHCGGQSKGFLFIAPVGPSALTVNSFSFYYFVSLCIFLLTLTNLQQCCSNIWPDFRDWTLFNGKQNGKQSYWGTPLKNMVFRLWA